MTDAKSTVEATLSLSGSKNILISNVNSQKVEKSITRNIKPGQTKFFFHCMAGLGSYKKEIYHEVRVVGEEHKSNTKN